MAPRANWKGYLKLSLVSCAVALFPATSTSERVRFNTINRKTGHRVHNQVVDAETGETVPEDDRVTGYKVENNSYVLVEQEELDEVALESTHTIDIESFVPRHEVDGIYLDTPYYLVSEDHYEEALAALITSKRGGKPPPHAPTPRPSNVVNLMDALRRSVQVERRQLGRETQGHSRAKAERAPGKRRRLKKAS